MRENTDWSDVVEEFRRLGGSADNICLRTGPFGRGIFPIDPSQPVLVRAPENLLLPVEEATFQDNKFRVAANSKIGSFEKAWLEHYMENYSWGGGARAELESFFEGLAALPESLRETLTNSFSIFCPVEPSSAVVQQRFLETRVIKYEERRVIMPIVELINHGPLTSYDFTNGVGVGGTFSDEVLVHYGGYDPFMMYAGWGFASPERTALSLPIGLNTEFGEIRVNNEFDKREPFWFGKVEMEVPLPKLTLEDGKFTLSFVVLGWKGFPRMPKGVFRRLFREAGHAITDEPFERLQYANRLRFLELLTKLEDVREAVAARTLRAMCYYQLEALAHSYGAREL